MSQEGGKGNHTHLPQWDDEPGRELPVTGQLPSVNVTLAKLTSPTPHMYGSSQEVKPPIQSTVGYPPTDCILCNHSFNKQNRSSETSVM